MLSASVFIIRFLQQIYKQRSQRRQGKSPAHAEQKSDYDCKYQHQNLAELYRQFLYYRILIDIMPMVSHQLIIQNIKRSVLKNLDQTMISAG